MPRTALYTGTFDPVTNGHLHVVRRACRLVDRLVIAIGVHSAKTPAEAEMLRAVCGPVAAAEGTALEVVTFDDLAVADAADDDRRAEPPRRRDGEVVESHDLERRCLGGGDRSARTARSISARPLAEEHRRLRRMHADRDHQAVDEPAGPPDDVEMAVGDGIEGAGVEGGAGHDRPG